LAAADTRRRVSPRTRMLTSGGWSARAVPLARRSVLADPRRLLTTVAGVGTALALIMLLWGLWTGLQAQASAYADNAGADLIVAASGTGLLDDSLQGVRPLGVRCPELLLLLFSHCHTSLE
jgi:hypothetical protein